MKELKGCVWLGGVFILFGLVWFGLVPIVAWRGEVRQCLGDRLGVSLGLRAFFL